MWLITLRDLQFRARRFVIATIGTSLVFGMALVLTGLSTGFRTEAARTVQGLGGDHFLVRAGVAGPFTTFAAFPQAVVRQLRREEGVRRAEPFMVLRQTIDTGGGPSDINVFAHRIGGVGEPPPEEGRRAAAPGEAVVDDETGLALGDRFTMGGRRFRVVGEVRGMTANAGIPNAYVPIEDGQAIGFDGKPVATSLIMAGSPAQVPAGFRVLSDQEARDDIIRPLQSGVTALDNSQLFLWVIAAIIIGVVVYLSALERVRDFAVLKATGASSFQLFAGLALQAVAISLISAASAVVLARVLVPLFPLTVDIPARSFALLPAVAMVVGVAASLSGLRRAVSVDPALAFGRP